VLDSATLYVIAVIFFATLIRSTFGFGEALVAVPLLALRTPVAGAAPLAVLVSVLIAAVIVIHDWRRIEIRSALWLIISAFCGIPLGLLLLTTANDQAARLTLGLVIAAFSIYSLFTGTRFHLEKDHPLWLLGAGFCSGVLGGAYGMNGPPLAIYGALRRWPPQRFRATLQGYFLPVSLAGMLGYGALGLWTATVTKYFVFSLPGAIGAILLGRAVNNRLRGENFIRYVHVGLIAIGAALVAQACASF
jgi:uncharacterized membrane protein YfcA